MLRDFEHHRILAVLHGYRVVKRGQFRVKFDIYHRSGNLQYPAYVFISQTNLSF
jgi:hypothetical protein